MNKGFIFSGDSFTWGEGLELFSKLPSTQKYFIDRKYSMEGPYNMAWNPKFKNSHRLFQQKNRFSRIVSTHFNTWDDVYDRNGGCLYANLDELFVQMERTPLEDVYSIIIQVTHPWREVRIYDNPDELDFAIGMHPSTRFFRHKKSRDTGNISRVNVLNELKYFGSNLGYKKYKNLLNTNFFHQIENSFEKLIRFCYSYSEYKNNKISYQTFLESSDMDDINLSTADVYLDFCMLELSMWGNSFDEIYKNLEIKLCSDYINFIIDNIKPLCDLTGTKIYFLPVWNETWKSYYNTEIEFYKNNCIDIIYNNESYPSFESIFNKFSIENTKGYEWTRNQHPNLEGHKIIANSIIKFIENKK